MTKTKTPTLPVLDALMTPLVGKKVTRKPRRDASADALSHRKNPPTVPVPEPEIPSIPAHVLAAEAICPPATIDERMTLLRAAKDAHTYHKTYGVKPYLLELFERYRKLSNDALSIERNLQVMRDEADGLGVEDPATNHITTGAMNIMKTKTTTKKATSTKPVKAAVSSNGRKRLTPEELIVQVKRVMGLTDAPATASGIRRVLNGEGFAVDSVRVAEIMQTAKVAPAASKPATPKASKPAAKRAEGNGSLTRAKVTPLPKAMAIEGIDDSDMLDSWRVHGRTDKIEVDTRDADVGCAKCGATNLPIIGHEPCDGERLAERHYEVENGGL